MARKESPAINGFTISNLKIMQGMDGYTIKCSLNRYGLKMGEFYDNGDGSEYYFQPLLGCTQNKIENYLRKLPLIESDFGLPPIHWNIGILVDKLIHKNDLKKSLSDAEKKNCNIIFLEDKQKGIGYILQCPKSATDDQLSVEMDRKYPAPRYAWVRYTDAKALNESIPI